MTWTSMFALELLNIQNIAFNVNVKSLLLI